MDCFCDFFFNCLWRVYIKATIYMALYPTTLKNLFISSNRKYCIKVRGFVLHKTLCNVNGDNFSFCFLLSSIFLKTKSFVFLYFLDYSGKDFHYCDESEWWTWESYFILLLWYAKVIKFSMLNRPCPLWIRSVCSGCMTFSCAAEFRCDFIVNFCINIDKGHWAVFFLQLFVWL